MVTVHVIGHARASLISPRARIPLADGIIAVVSVCVVASLLARWLRDQQVASWFDFRPPKKFAHVCLYYEVV